MKRFVQHQLPIIGVVLLLGAAAVRLTCAGSQGPPEVDIRETQHLIDISELTPRETQRLEQLLNSEVSPCGEDVSLVQALFDARRCPLAPLAADFMIEMLKDDYNVEEVSAAYMSRYAAVKGLGIPIDGSPVIGPEKPTVALVVFSDFECPVCARAAAQVHELMRAYPEHIAVVFKHYPLEIHPQAELAARAAYAAGRQDKFWEMHDTLFSAQGSPLDRQRIETMAIGLGLDPDQFDEDLASDAATQAIAADRRLGEQLGVAATPALFVNGRPLTVMVDGEASIGGLAGLEERIREEFLRHAVLAGRTTKQK